MTDVPDDPHLVELLDGYLRQVQAGAQPDRAAFGREHPELGPYLECLDSLENMFPLLPGQEDATLAPEEPRPAGAAHDFGSYELLGEIGRGGMGVVYKARQKGLDRLVAVKMILASHLASAEHVRRFQEEARAAAGLRHSNIVHIHEVGQIHGQHFFTMEYIEGMSLADRIKEGPLAPQETARLLATVARAVDHLHQHDVVHRDLKPSNILLDAAGEPYVTDFGLAKVFVPGSEMTTTGAVLGTPSYMSPEQAAGQPSQVGPGSDVYSLGAVLYEMLTGRPPFREDNPVETLLEVINGEPLLPRELNPHVPRPLELICLRCLARSPEDRYASAGALAEDLEHYLRGEALDARPPGIVQRLWSWVRREPALASRLATLSAFLGVDVANYAAGTPADFCLEMAALIGLWLLIAVVFQQFLKSGRWSIPARFVWGTLDSVLLLAALFVADGAASPLVVGYPLLIVASGLWFRVRFVWFVTGLSLVSYALLVVDFYFWRPDDLRASFPTRFDRHVIFALALLATAGVIAYLVDRLRTLSTYYGQKL
jgi:serine/threonine-protein kinase